MLAAREEEPPIAFFTRTDDGSNKRGRDHDTSSRDGQYGGRIGFRGGSGSGRGRGRGRLVPNKGGIRGTCWHCLKPGHHKSECWHWKRARTEQQQQDGPHANVAAANAELGAAGDAL